jgi:hypothetical protein
MPDESLRDHSSLACELFDLLIFRTGRPFDDRPTAAQKQDWSQVVWDLLEMGTKKSFNRKVSGRHRSSRTAGGEIRLMDGNSFISATSSMCLGTAAEIVGRRNASILYDRRDDIPPVNREGREDEEEPGAGVSVVLIETSERETGTER